jgi:hypothetical protein
MFRRSAPDRRYTMEPALDEAKVRLAERLHVTLTAAAPSETLWVPTTGSS